MSTMTVVICDKCGDTCKFYYHLAVRYHNDSANMGTAEVDLCTACYSRIVTPATDWRKPPTFRDLVPAVGPSSILREGRG